MWWLQPMDDPGRAYLHWSPDLAGVCRAADREVEEVEHPQVHREREQPVAGSDGDRDDPFGAPSPIHADDASSCSLLSRISPVEQAHGKVSTVTRRVADEPVPCPTSEVVGTRAPNRGEYHPRTGSSSAVCDVQARPSGSSNDPWWRS